MPSYSRLLAILYVFIVASSDPLFAQTSSAPDDEGQRLHELFDREWEYKLKTAPTYASFLGDKRYDDVWPDMSIPSIEEQYQHALDVKKELATFDVSKLSPEDRVNLQLFAVELSNTIDAHPFRWYLVPLTNREGIQIENETIAAMSFEKLKDYEDLIKRLETFDVYMDQTLALMQKGIDEKVVQSRVVMEPVVGQIRRQIVDRPTASLFYKPFLAMPQSIGEDDQKRLQSAGQKAITEHVIPAYEKMLIFFQTKYLPACFPEPGVWQLEDGKDFYAHRCRLFTTTSLTPEEIHQIGLSEVTRIRTQMEQIIADVKFEGSFQEFLNYLRTNPKFYFTTENDYVQAVESLCKEVDPKLVKLFKRLPRMPYGVERIPANIAPDTTAAYYREPSLSAMRAGTYFINTYDLKSRPKYEIAALSLHESVPGHHLQIALAMEFDELPMFRRYAGYTAFIEGWGLYSESLGDEMGLYDDPYSKFGQLTYEMWRACRLVIDTGIHYHGWSRQKSIDFMANNSAKSILDITNEVDRYIAWPGQALAYKIGELKIKELRAKAEAAMGDDFDIRDFHDVVLSSGAVTLDVLETNVNTWIDEYKTSKK